MSGRLQKELSCRCKSTCSTKSGRIRVGCPCKTANKKCTSQCSCGTRQKPCKNKATDQPERREPDRASEAQERDLENQRVKEFILTLDEEMAKKLAIRALQRGVGSMEFIDMLLIMEDPDESSDESSVAPLAPPLDPSTSGSSSTDQPTPLASGAVVPRPTSTMENLSERVPDWCKCGPCRTMPQEIENKCCIRNNNDIRNDRDDNSSRAFRKTAYRHFIIDKYGYLGKNKRKVCPSCCVLAIRRYYPSPTGVYMGFRSH
ncbi:uncharacterized protein [Montipora foliosa]|uniref:uncharacterized protein n=1 Tax=Montipora foliosa TaxID=591990 RepID=UPI0035F10339